MKPKYALLASVFGTMTLGSVSHAQSTLTWDANAATAAQTDGAGAWLGANQWWTGSTNTTWTSGDSAVFGNGGAGGAVTLGVGGTTAGSLAFNYFTGTYTLGTVGNTLTLNNGIAKNAGTGTLTIAGPITLGGAQTWNNNSTGAIQVSGAQTLNLNGNALTFDGDGTFTMSPSGGNTLAISGAGGIIKSGNGSLILDSNPTVTHTFSGGITINGGRVAYQTAANVTGRGNVTLNGGYLAGRFGSSATFSGLGTGATEIRIIGGVSGFSGEGTSGSTFQIGSALSTLQWGTTNFNPSVLLLGGAGANNNGTGSLNNAINLNGANRIITSTQVTDGAAASGFVLSGAITNSTGTAGFTKNGVGNLILAANNTYNGTTNIAAGSITLSGATGRISGTSGLTLSGGTLRMVSTNAQNTVDRLNSNAITVAAGGGISWENTAGANSFAETIGSIAVNGGALNVNLATNQNSTGSQTLTLGGLSQSGTGSVNFVAATTGPQASGNKNMVVVTGSGNTAGGQIIGSWATTGTTSAAITDYAVYNSNHIVPAAIAASGEGTWTNSSNAYTAGLVGTTATRLSSTRNIAALKLEATTATPTVDATANTFTVAGSSFSNGDVVSFGGTAPTGLFTGIPYYVVGASGTTFSVAATSGGPAIDITAAGTPNIIAGVTLGTGANLGTTGILNSSGAGLTIGKGSGGVVTLPSTTSANLHINTGNSNVIVGAPVADNGSGVLTLVKDGASILRLIDVNTYTGNTAINAGTLQIGINGQAPANGASLGSGSYAGNIFIGAGATLDIQTTANQTLSGVISGAGSIVKRNTGSLTLSGNNTFTGKFSITPLSTAGSGTVSVSSFNSVVGGTASSSLGAPTTVANGTIDFGSSSVQASLQLNYTGAGETTDRVINFGLNGNANRTIDAGSGGGLLKFTSAPTGNSANNFIILQGTSNGEFTQGLPFAWSGGLTKSGSGTWTLGGAVGNSGLLTVNAGTLALQKKNSLMGGNMANWTAALINVKSGATFALNVDSGDVNGLSSTSLNTLLTNISVANTSAQGLQSGARLGLDTSTATGGTFTQGNAIANSTGASGGAIGLTKLGTGTLVLDKTNTYTGSTLVNGGTLAVTGSGSINTSSSITIASGAEFKYNSSTALTVGITNNGGKVSGSGNLGAIVLGGTGSIDPGNSPGIMTAGSTDPSGGLDYNFEFTVANADPTWSNASASGNDVLRLTGGSPFAGALDGDNVVSIYLDVASVSPGDIFTGGFFTDLNSDFLSTISSGSFQFFIQDAGGLISYNGETYSAYAGPMNVDTIQIASANFAGGGVTNGWSTQFTAVPEPGAALFGGIGTLLLLRRRRSA